MRGWIYDRALPALTAQWYRHVLERLPVGARLLDVGIGTGGALCRNDDLVKLRDVRITGVDIDADYLRRCDVNVRRAELSGHVTTYQQSILDFAQGGFDAAYFSASFMLMPDPDAVLAHVVDLVRPGGQVFFTQTFEEKPSAFTEFVKPLLHRVTTIHFGEVTYESDFMETVRGAGLDVVEHRKLGGGRRRSGRLVVTQPALAPG